MTKKEYNEHVDRCYGPLMAEALTFPKSSQFDAEDIVQSIFMWLWKNKEKYDSVPCKFLIQRMKWRYMDKLRNEKGRPELHIDDPANRPREEFTESNDWFVDKCPYDLQPESNPGTSVDLKYVVGLIHNLPHRAKEIVIQRIFEEKSAQEVANNLNISVAGVNIGLYDARKKLEDQVPELTSIRRVNRSHYK